MCCFPSRLWDVGSYWSKAVYCIPAASYKQVCVWLLSQNDLHLSFSSHTHTHTQRAWVSFLGGINSAIRETDEWRVRGSCHSVSGAVAEEVNCMSVSCISSFPDVVVRSGVSVMPVRALFSVMDKQRGLTFLSSLLRWLQGDVD